jgi:hypothetical protein
MLAALVNAEDFVEIEVFAKVNKDILRKYIELEKGIPSHDTIQKVVRSIKPEVMKELFEVWNKMS